ncbi:MAG: mannitol-1-phosphate 5-dehydrogenase [Termitinemataceae bacterium]|nr:MAG: mannitol-1-phosphate 5-dehydrogenase [Termitinemataceae bacterium]
MQAVHFGAGNIGRGFIGEVLFKNGVHIDFVDISEALINALHTRGNYTVSLAAEPITNIEVSNVDGINSKTESSKVITAIANADIVTTAIGPGVLPFIADLIAQGLKERLRSGANSTKPLDVIACENMIGGSAFLFSEVKKHLSDDELKSIEKYIGFPNAAVDRIVPVQKNDDILAVSVEPFCEWVIEENACKNKSLKLNGVEYVDDLQPYIERKLFSVNTGHATVAYTGFSLGYKTIADAIKDKNVLNKLEAVLEETSALLINKWHFDKETHKKYIKKIIERFSNPCISDLITRVARTPIRKLGYDERFIRPIREAKERHLSYQALLETTKLIFKFYDQDDAESVKLQTMLKEKPKEQVIKEVTGLTDAVLAAQLLN